VVGRLDNWQICTIIKLGPVDEAGESAQAASVRSVMTDLSAFDDIPGTILFTAQRSRKGYNLNQFCMSLMKPENRERFKADERAYLEEWNLTDGQKNAVLNRDYNAALEEGGNIYFLAKIFSTDGLSYQQAVSTMTGMNLEDYAAMMLAGGRSPDGNRSIKEGC
jgi:protocatechuate 4,5-dioxygenase, alpha chain